MAFEIVHSKIEFDKLSPLGRAAAMLLGALVLIGLAWAAVTAYNAKPLDTPAQHAPHAATPSMRASQSPPSI
jgi:hypothetical protein